MNFRMIRTRNNFKVANYIIAFVAIFMVNNLTIKQLPAKMSFHDKPMFKNTFSINIKQQITVADSSRSSSSFILEEWVAMFPKPHVMFKAKSISMNFCRTFLDITNIGNGVSCKSARCLVFNHSVHYVPSLTYSIQQLQMEVNRDNRVKRMNSVKLLTGHAEDNTEPSCGYIHGRCNDYWRGLIPLITRNSVRPERDEIVYSL
jgi:hypothetical protein